MSVKTNILKQIDSIDFEDLYLVEKDLCFHEKVSISFLLFADKKSNAEFILQKLLAIWPNKDAITDILISYTKVNKNWKPFLVEALAIIKAKKILRKLGFNQSDVRTHFLPHIPELSLHINPILKALYSMCEMLTPVEAGKLVLYIRDGLNTNDHLRFYNFDYLEVFLLDWITKRALDASCDATTDISILLDYCKLNDMKTIKDMLMYSLGDINFDSEKKEFHQTNSVEYNLSSEKVKSSERLPEAPPLEDRLSAVKPNNCYKVDRETAGFVLIINQENFYQSENPELKFRLPNSPLMKREGTNVDKLALAQTFSSFGYVPIFRDNLNHIDMLSSIREAVKRSFISDSLIVCILTHGLEGSVYGCDSIPIEITRIEKILTADTLLSKPKMLIIQACQGAILQRARPVGDLETDSGEKSSAVYSDMVKAMSTVPGFASLRHTKTGTWFIQTLCKKINQLGDRDHMLDILTEVNAEVGDKRGIDNDCMTPISSQTLRKKFHLPSRLK